MRVRSFIDADPEFTAMPLVYIEIRGRLLRKFHRWRLDNKVYFEHGGGGGMGRTSAYYPAEVAEKVLAWLKEQGAKETAKVPSWRPKK